ncbi:hypothetical protein V8G54_012871 [Vigna mungo]|uniref:Uncharacterized protein n=1 Tax=Vigna mungo TaxID=3915 RepID=A0AAQ3NT25_VIGMU
MAQKLTRKHVNSMQPVKLHALEFKQRQEKGEKWLTSETKKRSVRIEALHTRNNLATLNQRLDGEFVGNLERSQSIWDLILVERSAKWYKSVGGGENRDFQM